MTACHTQLVQDSMQLIHNVSFLSFWSGLRTESCRIISFDANQVFIDSVVPQYFPQDSMSHLVKCLLKVSENKV